MIRIAVVGAGISGLTTAHYLSTGLEKSGGTADIFIFESAAEPGGTMRTVREQGFLMEWGPNGFLTNKPQAWELVRELGMESRLLRSCDLARQRFIWAGGRMHRLPETPPAFLRSHLLSWPGRLRVMAEPFAPAPPADRDESIAEFAIRRLGAEALEKLIEPMTAGVFAGNPDELSLRSCFPRIHELEDRYGGLIMAMMRLRWERRGRAAAPAMSAGPGGVLTSFDTGVQALVEVLAGRLKANLRLGCAVKAVTCRQGKYRLAVPSAPDDDEYDVVVVAAPSYAAGEILRGLDEGLAAELDRIPYAPVAVVALGFDAGALHRPLDGFGFLVPRQEGRRILGALWDSSVFPGRAPRDKALIRVMVGGARQPGLARLHEDELTTLARAELRETMGITAGPSLARVFRHEHGIPQYLQGHPRLLERVSSRLAAWPGLHLNSNAYRGVSLNDCVRQSRIAAERVLDDLNDRMG